MSQKTILVEKEVEHFVAWLTLNRPQRLNAINMRMRGLLPAILDDLAEDDGVRAVVIQGAGGKAFCAGADVSEFQAFGPRDFSEANRFQLSLAQFPKPVIAAIDGYCLGGGMELALACDFRLASRRSQLGQPEIRLGLIPGGGGTQRLARLVGTARAKQLCMLGDRIAADRAERWGLVDFVYEDELFKEKVRHFAIKLARQAPLALQFTKRIVDEGAQAPLSTALLLEREAFGLLFATEDMKEGTQAFLEKREPQFKGR